MTIKTTIKDGRGTGNEAEVTSRGQLVVSSIDFSTFYSVTLDTINTGFEIAPPVTGKIFIITTIELYADKSVGASDASVELYESDQSAVTTVVNTVFKTEIPKVRDRVLTGLNVKVSQGKWLNAKTNDNNIFVNVAGYYVDA